MEEDSVMHHRSGDQPGPWRVDRVIPSWGIVLLAIAGIGQAGAVYLGQRDLASVVAINAEKQREETSRMSAQIATLGAQVESLSRANNGRDLSTLENKMRLDVIERWRAEIDQSRNRYKSTN